MDKETVLLLLLSVIIAIMSITTTAPVFNDVAEDFSLERDCLYNGKLYSHSSSIETEDSCLNCTCNRGVLVCFLRVCPNLVPQPNSGCYLAKTPGTCCAEILCGGKKSDESDSTTSGPTSEPEEDVVTTSSVSSILSTVADDSTELSTLSPANFTVDDNSINLGCWLNGSLYAEGSAMLSSSFCEYCYCIRGEQRCIKPQCHLTIDDCGPIYHHGFSCCPSAYLCKRRTSNASQTTTTTWSTSRHDCVVNGMNVKEGDPVATSDVCSHCFCVRGKVQCSNITCPLHMDRCKPIIQPGKCCPTGYNCSSSAVRISTSESATELILGSVATSKTSTANVADNILFLDTEGSESQDSISVSLPLSIASNEGSNISNESLSSRDNDRIIFDEDNRTVASSVPLEISQEPIDGRNASDLFGRHEPEALRTDIDSSTREEETATEIQDAFVSSEQSVLGVARNGTVYDDATDPPESESVISVGDDVTDEPDVAAAKNTTSDVAGHSVKNSPQENSTESDDIAELYVAHRNGSFSDEHQGRIAPPKQNETVFKNAVSLNHVKMELNKSENGTRTSIDWSDSENSSSSVATSSSLEVVMVDDPSKVNASSTVDIFNQTYVESEKAPTDEPSSSSSVTEALVSFQGRPSGTDILLEAEESGAIYVTRLPIEPTESNAAATTTADVVEDGSMHNNTVSHVASLSNETVKRNNVSEGYFDSISGPNPGSLPNNNNRTLIGSLSSIVSLLLDNTSNSSSSVATSTAANSNSHDSDNQPYFSDSNSEGLFNHADSFDALLEDLVGETPGEVQFNSISYVNFNDSNQHRATTERTAVPLTTAALDDTATEETLLTTATVIEVANSNFSETTMTIDLASNTSLQDILVDDSNETFLTTREDTLETDTSTSVTTVISVPSNGTEYPEHVAEQDDAANSSSHSNSSSSLESSVVLAQVESNSSEEFESSSPIPSDEPVFETADLDDSSTTEFHNNDLEETLEMILNLSKTYATMNRTGVAWGTLNSSTEGDLLNGNIPIEVEAKIAEIVRLAQVGLNSTGPPFHGKFDVYNSSMHLSAADETSDSPSVDYGDYYEDYTDGIPLGPVDQNGSVASSNESVFTDLHRIFIPLSNLSDSVGSLPAAAKDETFSLSFGSDANHDHVTDDHKAVTASEQHTTTTSSTSPPSVTDGHGLVDEALLPKEDGGHHTVHEVLSDVPKVDDPLDGHSQHFDAAVDKDEHQVHEHDKEEESLEAESSQSLDDHDDQSYFSKVEVVVPDEEKSYFGADDFNGGGGGGGALGRREEEVGEEISAADAAVHDEEGDHDQEEKDPSSLEHAQGDGEDSDHFRDVHTESVVHSSGTEIHKGETEHSDTDNDGPIEVPSSHDVQVNAEDASHLSNLQYEEHTDSPVHVPADDGHADEASGSHTQGTDEDSSHSGDDHDKYVEEQTESSLAHVPENDPQGHESVLGSSESTVSSSEANNIPLHPEDVAENEDVPEGSTFSDEFTDGPIKVPSDFEVMEQEVPDTTTIEATDDSGDRTPLVPEATELTIDHNISDVLVTSNEEEELRISDAAHVLSSTLSDFEPDLIDEDHPNISYPSFDLAQDEHKLIDSQPFYPVAISNEATTAFVGLMSKGSVHFDNVLPLSRRGRPNTGERTDQALPTPRKSSVEEAARTNSSVDSGVQVIPFLPEDAITDELYQEPVKASLAPRNEDGDVVLTSTDDPETLEQVLEKNGSTISVRLGASSVVQVHSSSDDLVEVPKMTTDNAESHINLTDVVAGNVSLSAVTASRESTTPATPSETTSLSVSTSAPLATTPLIIETSTSSLPSSTATVATRGPMTTTLALESSTAPKRKEEKRIDLPMPTNAPFSADGVGHSQKPDYCVENGEVFQNGERIPTLDFCAQCKCDEGEILCQHVSCPKRPAGCVERILPSSCCPTFVCNETDVDSGNSGSLPVRAGITIHGGFLPIERPIMQSNDDRHLMAHQPPLPTTAAPTSANSISLAITKKPETIPNDSGSDGQVSHEVPITSEPKLPLSNDGIISNEQGNKKEHEPETELIISDKVHKTQEKQASGATSATLPTEATVASIKSNSDVQVVAPESESAATTETRKPLLSALQIEFNDRIDDSVDSKRTTKGSEDVGRLTQSTSTTTTAKNEEEPANSLWALLKVSSCNVYGRVYQLGSVIGVLSGPCKECKCTDTGVNCYRIKCF